MDEYILHTNKGKFKINADSPEDAVRLGLYYSWRDGEYFERIEFRKGGDWFTYRIVAFNHNTHECFTMP